MLKKQGESCLCRTFEAFWRDLFSFFVDKILQNCRRAILKLQKDSPESGEHFKYQQSMPEVSRKKFQSHFQKSYFPKNPRIFMGFGHFPLKKQDSRENMTFENVSENIFQTLQNYFVGIWNVLQTQGYLSVTSEWSYDTFNKIYRRKTKFFQFFHQDKGI